MLSKDCSTCLWNRSLKIILMLCSKWGGTACVKSNGFNSKGDEVSSLINVKFMLNSNWDLYGMKRMKAGKNEEVWLFTLNHASVTFNMALCNTIHRNDPSKGTDAFKSTLCLKCKGFTYKLKTEGRVCLTSSFSLNWAMIKAKSRGFWKGKILKEEAAILTNYPKCNFASTNRV